MNFCTLCHNMYYIALNETTVTETQENGLPPKIYLPGNRLVYYCRNCGHQEKNASFDACIMETSHDNEEQKIRHLINPYTKYDPTLPRLYYLPCPNDDCVSNIEKREQDAAAAAAPGEDGGDKSRSASSTTKREATGEVVYIRYDDKNLKYVYLCVDCNCIWKTQDTKKTNGIASRFIVDTANALVVSTEDD